MLIWVVEGVTIRPWWTSFNPLFIGARLLIGWKKSKTGSPA